MPAKPGCHRRRGRGYAGACGRTSPIAFGHNTRRLFFSPPNQRDHPCLGIAEHTLDRRLWAEAGEPIGIEQTPRTLRCSRHRQSVPDFSSTLKPAMPCSAWATPRSDVWNHPHVSTKSPFCNEEAIAAAPSPRFARDLGSEWVRPVRLLIRLRRCNAADRERYGRRAQRGPVVLGLP